MYINNKGDRIMTTIFSLTSIYTDYTWIFTKPGYVSGLAFQTFSIAGTLIGSITILISIY